MNNEAFTIAVAVNSETDLQNNLLLSPGLLDDGRNQLIVKRNSASAAVAYNSAIEEAGNDIIIFIHQDMYLPDGWFGDLKSALAFLASEDPNWGVLGCFGSRKDAEGGVGRLHTRGLGRHGRRIARPEPVETLDEIVLIIRKSSGLRFDSRLPHFHLYGTDLCLTARDRGMASYAFQGFCVHNTNQLLILPKEFYRCYAYIRKKWAKYLPIYASCMTISSRNAGLYRRRLVEAGQRLLGMPSLGELRVADPRAFSHEQD